jgi:hypothetical protein
MKSLFVITALLSLTACYEDTDVTLHEAGVYKGKVDKHSQTFEEREVILKKRFNQVQTDR